MNRQEAYISMQAGNKIRHRDFTSDEYYQLINNKIIAEDNVNHTHVFWEQGFMKDGWSVYEESK